MMNERAKVAAQRAANRPGRVAEAPVTITRATVYIGRPTINQDDNSTWVDYTVAVEINNRTQRGIVFSGQMPFPAGRTQTQRRAAVQQILQVDGPGYFPAGSTVSSTVELDWIGI